MNNELLEQLKKGGRLNYNVIVQTVTQETELETTNLCNAVSVRNIGDTPATINGIRLLPSPGAGLSGESVSWGGNFAEFYRGRLQVIFLAPAGVNPLIEVTQKYYLYEQR